MAIVLDISEKSGNVKKSKNSQGKVREFEKNRKVRETSGNFDRLSEPRRSITPQVQLDDVIFC